MTFYEKFIKSARKGYTLRGGPFAKWRYPMNRVLYKKRLDAGPEPLRHRSVWSNWNYDSELFAFAKRLNEEFNENLLRQAFTDPSWSISQKSQIQDLNLGINVNESLNNSDLAAQGEKVCKNYIRAVFNFWYPNFPQAGVESVVNYLTSAEKLAYVANHIGMTDLVKTQEFPVSNETLRSSLLAVVAALSQSSKGGVVQAHLFVNDFILTQLIDKDVNEIWSVSNPMGLLCDELKRFGYKSLPQSRLIWSSGASTPTAVFVVGLYTDTKFLSKGSGETLDIAEEMAARDALRRLYGTGEEAAPLPFGEKARKYSQFINAVYQKLVGSSS